MHVGLCDREIGESRNCLVPNATWGFANLNTQICHTLLKHSIERGKQNTPIALFNYFQLLTSFTHKIDIPATFFLSFFCFIFFMSRDSHPPSSHVCIGSHSHHCNNLIIPLTCQSRLGTCE